ADAPVSTLYLLAVLNHPLCEAMIRTNTSTFRGGYYSHGKQFIQNLPVPIPDDTNKNEIEGLARRMVTSTEELAAARTPHEIRRRERALGDLRTRLERRVGEIFNLSEADWDTVKSVPVPE
ncbi:MAG: hypothetical protein AAFV54_13120, partial [Pseudomonadota bacterium]